MKTIRFEDITVKKGRIDAVTYITENGEEKRSDKIWFEFSKKITPGNDAVAAALCTLCGVQYEEVYIDLEISQKVYEELNKFVQNVLTVKGTRSIEKASMRAREKFILNFSGGYDSLAALCLMPKKDTKLVSVNWGKNFNREAEFFKRFKPLTVNTNVRELRYTDAHWTFMGIGSILYSEFLRGGGV